MVLVSSFAQLLQQLAFVMTERTFANYVILMAGWIFARRRTVTGMILAANAVNEPGGRRTTKHHSAFHRVFAAARWSLDELGLAVFDLILPWLPQNVAILLGPGQVGSGPPSC